MNDEIRFQKAKRVSLVSILGNLTLTIAKLVAGFFAGSTALVADAFHSSSDLIGTIILLKGMQIAHQPADENHPFGHHRAETITSEILAFILMITAAGIGYKGFQILTSNHIAIPGAVAVYIAIFSILSKELMYRYSAKVGKEINSDAIIADAWHHRSDAFSSIAALVGILGARMGMPFMDPIAAFFVAILIFRAGLQIYKKAVSSLMDTAPSNETLNALSDIIISVEGVKQVDDLRVRYYGSKMIIDLKISVLPELTVEDGHNVAGRAKARIMERDERIQDVLIHVNPYYTRS
ncbi:cation diffusion facilitator family transporter [Tindallia magadiensis]|uniref:Cation diffusion facilitator family transporter n=1 Tax=Tindallia magadiensis TaxID=69895 RepID=A0A1I3B7S3_9FIRM|nr:cation diffusion facilitator family transporter [Tindallia magadiensis]SFH58019.1 cation diffusion facilitator family transporter [Tindallia magadiensis]